MRRRATRTTQRLVNPAERIADLVQPAPAPEPLRQPVDREAGVARSRTTTVRLQPMRMSA